MSEIRKVYYAQFFAGLSNVATVTFTLYFLKHGLTQAQIGQLFGFFMICLAILDIPTGGFADIFGHKTSVGLGFFCQAISFLLFFLFPNYSGFLTAMFLDATGLALQSGALSSLQYELLKKEKKSDTFQKIIGKSGAYFLIATIIASPIGTIIFKHFDRIPYFLAFFFFLLSGAFIYQVKWEFVKKSPTFSTYFKTIIDGIKLTLKNKILLSIVIIGIALTTNRLVFNQNIIQPYLVKIGVDVSYIGFIASAISAVLALVSLNAYKISQKLGKNFSLFLVIFVPNIAMIILGFINNLFAIPFIFMLMMGHTFRDPLFAHLSQDEVAKDKRSTMASTTSFLTSIIVGLALPYWGKGIDLYGMNKILLLLGMFSFLIGIGGLCLFKFGSKRN